MLDQTQRSTVVFTSESISRHTFCLKMTFDITNIFQFKLVVEGLKSKGGGQITI